MRILGVYAACLITLAPGVHALDLSATVGPGEGVVAAFPDDPPCDGVLLQNGDGTWEIAYAWGNEGVAPPDFGGFGEGYHAVGTVCGMRVYLTTVEGYYGYGPADAFVYESDGTNPASVLSVTTDVQIEQVAIWPEISIHEFTVNSADVSGDFFVYLWPNWPGYGERWFFAADRNGLPGLPRTKIVPGYGYPGGWQHPSVAFGPTRAMGVGAYVEEAPSPAASSSWSRIKSLFR